MSITGPMILPPDVQIIPASKVAEETRLQCACNEGDFIVTRPRSRTQSRVVNDQVAELLALFHQPKPIVEAVLTLCLTHGTDPESTLEQAFAALEPFIQSRWLVPADSEDARRIEPFLSPGDVVDGYTIVDCRHLLEDTEVYHVRTADNALAALKIARRGASGGLERTFKHEARILGHLNGQTAPRLLAAGRIEGQPYLAMTWCSGVVVTQAAAELRQLHGTAGRRRVLNLCRGILRAYAGLHERGVIHGDVYPKNILVDATDQVSVVDYGFARLVQDGDDNSVPRRGVPEFFEPELAAAALRGGSNPIASFAGEQYALAVLVYLLAAGEHYLRFSAVREEMLSQIVEKYPLTFAERGLSAWPKLEAVLLRALDKNPELRFHTLTEFIQALDEADPPEVAVKPPLQRGRGRMMSKELIARLDAEDIAGFKLPTEIPQCSITYGAAGVAYALYRVACARDDAALLSAADAWAVRAARMADQPDAFANDQLDLDESRIGHASVYYARPGIYLVQALIAQAMGNEASLAEAIRSYVSACQPPGECLDLTLGQAGILIGCALLSDAVGLSPWRAVADHPARQLVDLGQSALRKVSIVSEEDSFGRSDYLGIAHGRAGMCYAALLWSEVCGDTPPAYVRKELEKLVEAARDYGRGIRWPTKYGNDKGALGVSYMESWCHGTPGYVHLWTAAYRAFGEARYLQIAERAAWTAWEALESVGSLCCGDTGRAYALLNLFRHTGDQEWALRAMALSERAIEICYRDPRTNYSLFQGALGAAVLIEDLNQPERAYFPLFEREVRSSAALA
jgi:serine/threonine-protein kinase